MSQTPIKLSGKLKIEACSAYHKHLMKSRIDPPSLYTTASNIPLSAEKSCELTITVTSKSAGLLRTTVTIASSPSSTSWVGG